MDEYEVKSKLSAFNIFPGEDDLAVIDAIVADLQCVLPRLASLIDDTDPSALSFSPGDGAGA